MQESNFGTLIVYDTKSKEVIALIPMKLGETAVLKDGYGAKIVMDADSDIFEGAKGKLIYKGGK